MKIIQIIKSLKTKIKNNKIKKIVLLLLKYKPEIEKYIDRITDELNGGKKC